MKHTGVAADTDGGSPADNGRIGAEVMISYTACDKVEAEVDAEDDERDAPIMAEVPAVG